MTIIIYDIEATCWMNSNTALVQEIIELGACKLNLFGDIEEVFTKFIKPVLHPDLSVYCKELTGIRQEDVSRAKTFPVVIEMFKDWIDVDNEDFVLCSWGSFDKKMLINDSKLHNLDTDWLQNFINMKQQYQDFKKIKNSIGLMTVLDKENIAFTGKQHRATDDALNLAKIYVKYLDDWRI